MLKICENIQNKFVLFNRELAKSWTYLTINQVELT